MVANVSAQELVIREPFQMVPNDLTAAQAKYRRVDYNGNPCALIKVGLVDKSATFSGDVVHSEYKQGEWWVYMVEGSLYLKIKTNNNIPKEITFSPLKKLTTYKISFISNALNQPAVPMPEPLLPFYEKIDDEWLLGYLDNKGNIAIPATLKGEGTMFEGGTARVEYKRSWYFINTAGQEVAAPGPNWCHSGLHIVKQNGKYGYADKMGNLVLPIIYNWATDFYDNRAFVSFGDGCGFITPKGIVVFKGNYDTFWLYNNHDLTTKYCNNYAVVKKGDKYAFIDTNGVFQDKLGTYKYAENFSEGLAAVRNEKGGWGYINTYGRIVISFNSNHYGDSFSEGLAKSYEGVFSDYHYYINKKGNKIFKTKLWTGSFSEGLAVASKPYGREYGYIDTKGSIVISLGYEKAKDFYKGFARVKLFTPNHWVWIDKKGRILKDKYGRPFHSEPQDD